jgi:hypothetical protein
MLANSRHQWNRLGHYARNQAWICRLVGLEQPALHSFDVGSFFLSLVFFRNHCRRDPLLPVVVARTSRAFCLVGCAKAAPGTSVLPSTSARVLISAIVFIALSPALPCFFFSGVAPLGIFRGGAEAILAAQRPDFMVKRRIFLKRIKG